MDSSSEIHPEHNFCSPHLLCIHSPRHHHLMPELNNSFLSMLYAFALALLVNILQTAAAEWEFWEQYGCHFAAYVSLVSWAFLEYLKYTSAQGFCNRCFCCLECYCLKQLNGCFLIVFKSLLTYHLISVVFLKNSPVKYRAEILHLIGAAEKSKQV